MFFLAIILSIFVVGLPQKKMDVNFNYNQKENENNINFLIFAGSQGHFQLNANKTVLLFNTR